MALNIIKWILLETLVALLCQDEIPILFGNHKTVAKVKGILLELGNTAGSNLLTTIDLLKAVRNSRPYCTGH